MKVCWNDLSVKALLCNMGIPDLRTIATELKARSGYGAGRRDITDVLKASQPAA
jgi:hypothetical protein